MRAPIIVLLLGLSTVLAGCVGGDVAEPDDREETFDPLVPVGIARHLPVSAFEPTLGVTSTGALFMTAGGGSLSGSARQGDPEFPQMVYRSRDQGKTWEDVTASLGGVVGYPPNTNDPFVYVDPTTDRVYDFEMQGLSCNMLAYSDDEGEDWTPAPLGCTPTQIVQDHQSLFASKPRGVLEPVGYPNILHYCVNRVADSACAFSLDGGLTWGPMRPLIYDGIDEAKLVKPPTPDPDMNPAWAVCSGLTAHGIAAPDGTIYLPRGDCGGIPTVAISKDNGLTWTQSVISRDVLTYGAHGQVPYHEVNVAIDEAGHAYAVWKDEERRVRFAQSMDAGTTWSDAIDVTPEGVNITDLPVIAAGAEGRVAIAFVGTDADATKRYGDMTIDDHWHAWLVLATGLSTDTPTWTSVQTTPEDDPIARGVCGGTRCQAKGGGLGDFIDVVIDPEGRPWAAFVDVCHDACRNATELPERGAGLPVIGQPPLVGEGTPTVNDRALAFVGTLRHGPALRGEAVALPALLD